MIGYLLSDAKFWTAVAFVIFILVTYRPVKKILLKALDEKITSIKNKINDAKKIREDAYSLLGEIKVKKDNIKKEIDEIKKISENKMKMKLEEMQKKLENQLNQSIAFVSGTASTFLRWVHEFKKNHLNQLPLGDQDFFQAAGGDPKICYLHGYFDFDDDEYMEITTEIPDCEYWNFQLENHWMESLDYRHYPIHINESSADLNKDKSITINVSHSPKKLKNNLITEGRKNGAMLLRWIGATSFPIPTVEIKKLYSLQDR